MAAFVILWLLMDICWRLGCREAFEYRQHKGTLRKLHRDRTVPAKILGLYPSGRTLAPCHMRRYKRMRLVNLLVGAMHWADACHGDPAVPAGGIHPAFPLFFALFADRTLYSF